MPKTVDKVTAVTPPSLEVLARDYPKGHLIAPHRHDGGQIVFARAGVMRVITAAGAWVVPPQRAGWVPAGIEHSICCGSAVAMRTVYLHPAPVDRLGSVCAVAHVSPLLFEVLLRLVEGPCAAEQREHLVALMLSELAAGPAAPLHLPEPLDPRLRRLASILQAEPGDPRPLAAWAKQIGVSRRTLVRLFLAETGMTFRQWQRQLRLLVALERLAQEQPVTTVALELGYESVSAFISAFRRALGVTPKRYFQKRREAP